MKPASLCALLAISPACAPTPAKTPTIPIVDITLVPENSPIEELFPSKSYLQLSHQILNGLCNHPASKFDHRHSFEKDEFKIIAYFSNLDEENKDVLQYYVVNNLTNTMVVFLDNPPYGSLDGWYRCLQRGQGTLADTKDMFNCGMMVSHDKEVTKSFQETIELVHKHLQQQKVSISEVYKTRFTEILLQERYRAIFSEVKSVP